MTTSTEKEIIQEANVTETSIPIDAVAEEIEDTEPTSPVRAVRVSNRGPVKSRSSKSSIRSRAPRERGEFEQVTIDARRVARVMAGGRRFNFSLVVVVGDKKGRVGVGLGKGADTALAIDKAVRDAKKNLTTVLRTKSDSIPHQVKAKYASAVVEIIPSKGRGLVAGSAVRTVLDLAGITDVVTKIHTRSKNKLTIARATVEALKKLRLI